MPCSSDTELQGDVEAVYKRFCEVVIEKEILGGASSYRFADLHASLSTFQDGDLPTEDCDVM